MLKNTFLIAVFLISALIYGQELTNFYLEPNASNNSVTLHTTVYRESVTIFQGITIQINGNEIDVAICYLNSANQLLTFDHQEFPISLPTGYNSFILNVELFGDDDGLPCENNNLVGFGSIQFDYPYLPFETTVITDDNFEYYLENTFSGDGKPNNNLVFTHRIENINKLLLNDELISVDPIESLLGIEYMPNLQYLYCEQNLISSINVTANSNLIELTCSQNLIETIDVSNNPFLKKLWCGFNDLSTLDVTNNLLLENLYFSSESLTQIDLSQNSQLKRLVFNGNNLIGIDLSGNPNLITLGIGTSQFNNLDTSNNLLLEELSLSYTSIISLNLNNNTNLIKLNCEAGELTSLEVTRLTNLIEFFCNDNLLTSVDLSTNSGLEIVQLIQNNLSSLNIKNGNNHNLTTLITIANNELYCIDVDDENEAPYPGWNVDAHTSYSENCPPIGINEENFVEDISIYPNPTSQKIKIKSLNKLSNITIRNVLGNEIVYKKDLVSNSEGIIELDISRLTPGVYFITVGNKVKKFVKE